MEIEPGPVAVGTTGRVDGEVATVGFFRARIFADSVTSITFRGLPSFAVP